MSSAEFEFSFDPPREAKDLPITLIAIQHSWLRYWPKYFIDKDYYSLLMKEIQWHKAEATVYGQKYVMNRYQSGQGDPGSKYSFAGTQVDAEPWSPTVHMLKFAVEEITGAAVNFCLLNLYPPDSSLGWHSDDERDLLLNPTKWSVGVTVISISFGASRDFQVRYKGRTPDGSLYPIQTYSLNNGDLLTMEGNFQQIFKHCIPKRKSVDGYRINLTFRLHRI